MPNTREKLIELLHKGVRCPGVVDTCEYDCPYWSTENPCDEFGATVDMLIANGVTIINEHWATEQAYKNGLEDGKPKWISVSERLPEEGTDVLAYQNRGEESRIVPANYGCAVWFDCFFDCEADNITHWMPLPQPPKGD